MPGDSAEVRASAATLPSAFRRPLVGELTQPCGVLPIGSQSDCPRIIRSQDFEI